MSPTTNNKNTHSVENLQHFASLAPCTSYQKLRGTLTSYLATQCELNITRRLKLLRAIYGTSLRILILTCKQLQPVTGQTRIVIVVKSSDPLRITTCACSRRQIVGKIGDERKRGREKGLRIWRRGKEEDEENEDDERTRGEQPCGEGPASNKKSGSNYTPETFPGRPVPSSWCATVPL